ncbi:BTB/POZ and MATH domain-containing protein 2-like [Carex rostrata]
MASACVDETNFISTDGTTHQFQVNYLKSKNLSHSQCIDSSIFKSAGYKWNICCYPKGYLYNNYISIYLEIQSDWADLMVNFNLDILGKSGSEPFRRTFTARYKSDTNNSWGMHSFLKITNLEESYVTDDGYFQILCSINWTDKGCNGISRVPIGDVKEDIGKLWQNGEMTDVNFEVDGEIISAHMVILAARSSVFKAELFGNTAEGKIGCIRIEDMKPAVFRALLHLTMRETLIRPHLS